MLLNELTCRYCDRIVTGRIWPEETNKQIYCTSKDCRMQGIKKGGSTCPDMITNVQIASTPAKKSTRPMPPCFIIVSNAEHYYKRLSRMSPFTSGVAGGPKTGTQRKNYRP